MARSASAFAAAADLDPSQVLFVILTHLHDPIDLASFAAASRATHDYCHPHRHLWKTTFLQTFDPPARRDEPFDYEEALRQRIRARGLIHLANGGDQLARIVSAFDSQLPIFIALAQSATSPTSLNIRFLLDLFPVDSTFTAHYLSAAVAANPDVAQDVARFKTFYGPVWNSFTSPSINRAIRSVYTLTNYTPASRFGSYLHDGSGRVNWPLLHNIQVVMLDNIRDARESESWGELASGEKIELPGAQAWADAVRGADAGAQYEAAKRDWAGVESVWWGTYVFSEWTVFEGEHLAAPRRGRKLTSEPPAINRGDGRPIPAAQLRRQGVGECQQIALTLDPSAPSPTDAEPNPKQTFTGVLKARDVAPSAEYPSLAIAGFVERTPDRAIRWQYRVSYAGREQWSLEGVQIGEARSRAGVVGIWSHAAREEEGPCGPFWWFGGQEV